MKKNFNLFKLTILGYGLIFGKNKYGTVWMEVRFAKKLVKQINFRDYYKLSIKQRMDIEFNQVEYDYSYTPSFELR